jgi:hypothetical protein
MKFDLVVMKFDLAVMKFDFVVMKFNPAAIKFDLAVIEFNLPAMKFNLPVMKFSRTVTKFHLAEAKFGICRSGIRIRRGDSTSPCRNHQPPALYRPSVAQLYKERSVGLRDAVVLTAVVIVGISHKHHGPGIELVGEQ